jgi:hypothetical protein
MAYLGLVISLAILEESRPLFRFVLFSGISSSLCLGYGLSPSSDIHGAVVGTGIGVTGVLMARGAWHASNAIFDGFNKLKKMFIESRTLWIINDMVQKTSQKPIILGDTSVEQRAVQQPPLGIGTAAAVVSAQQAMREMLQRARDTGTPIITGTQVYEPILDEGTLVFSDTTPIPHRPIHFVQ